VPISRRLKEAVWEMSKYDGGEESVFSDAGRGAQRRSTESGIGHAESDAEWTSSPVLLYRLTACTPATSPAAGGTL